MGRIAVYVLQAPVFYMLTSQGKARHKESERDRAWTPDQKQSPRSLRCCSATRSRKNCRTYRAPTRALATSTRVLHRASLAPGSHTRHDKLHVNGYMHKQMQTKICIDKCAQGTHVWRRRVSKINNPHNKTQNEGQRAGGRSVFRQTLFRTDIVPGW